MSYSYEDLCSGMTESAESYTHGNSLHTRKRPAQEPDTPFINFGSAYSVHHHQAAPVNNAPTDNTDDGADPDYESRTMAHTSSKAGHRGDLKFAWSNVTTSFAQSLTQEEIARLRPDKRAHIQSLLDTEAHFQAQRRLEEEFRAHSGSRRRTAEEMFPGTWAGRSLKWSTANHDLKNRFGEIQFRRLLYAQGVSSTIIKSYGDKDRLVAFWEQYRDQHGLANVGARKSTATVEKPAEDKAVAEETVGPEVDGQTADAEANTAEKVIEFDALLEETGNPGEDTAAANTQDARGPISMASMYGGKNENQSAATDSRPTTPDGGVQKATTAKKAQKKTKDQKQKDLNKAVKAEYVALAARVGRYPLQIPGVDGGRTLSMQRRVGAGAIYHKTTRPMMLQLADDYGLLAKNEEAPGNPELAEIIVKGREALEKSKATLQPEWTHERLKTYVANKEAKTSNSSSAPTADATNNAAFPSTTKKTNKTPAVQNGKSKKIITLQDMMDVNEANDNSTNKKKRARASADADSEDDDEERAFRIPRPKKLKLSQIGHESSPFPAELSEYANAYDKPDQPSDQQPRLIKKATGTKKQPAGTKKSISKAPALVQGQGANKRGRPSAYADEEDSEEESTISNSRLKKQRTDQTVGSHALHVPNQYGTAFQSPFSQSATQGASARSGWVPTAQEPSTGTITPASAYLSQQQQRRPLPLATSFAPVAGGTGDQSARPSLADAARIPDIPVDPELFYGFEDSEDEEV